MLTLHLATVYGKEAIIRLKKKKTKPRPIIKIAATLKVDKSTVLYVTLFIFLKIAPENSAPPKGLQD